MVLAITVIAAALGTITEFQIRVRHVGPSADGTFMPVRRGVHHGFLGMGGGSPDICLGPVCVGFFMCGGGPAKSTLPAFRQNVEAVCAEEQEVVQKSKQREEIKPDQIRGQQEQVHPGQIFHFDGNDVHQKDTIVRVKRCQCQKQAHIQVGASGHCI